MSTIAAGTTTTTALVSTGDTTGALVLQTNGTTTAVIIDTSQNVGVGVTPTAWNSIYDVIQFGPTGAVFCSSSNESFLGNNLFYNSLNTGKYLATDAASLYYQTAGTHNWFTAPSGTAGNTINFTQVLAIEGSKSLALQGATPQTGTGITFPATQSASSNANTLDDYEEGSFTFTGTGFTTSPTKTAYYTKIGDQVTVQLPDITGTSNTTAMTITGLPVALRSARAYAFFGIVYNASVAYNGYFYGAHDNAVTVYWNAVSDAFTASGVKGITNNVSITYTIN
jgi:hypothetical protein